MFVKSIYAFYKLIQLSLINKSMPQFERPSKQCLKQYLHRQNTKYQKADRKSVLFAFLGCLAWSVAFSQSMVYAAGPTGVVRRQAYQKSLNPVLRHLKRGSPVLIALGGLIIIDNIIGTWD